MAPGYLKLQIQSFVAPGYLKLQIQNFVAPGYLKLWIQSFVAPGYQKSGSGVLKTLAPGYQKSGSRVLKLRLPGTKSLDPELYSVACLTCPHALGLTVQLSSVYSSVHVSS